MLKNLFSEKNIGTLTLKNRVIMPAMGTKMPDAEGYVTDQLVNYHAARAKGGCALNIVEVAAIHPSTKPPYFLAIDHDKYIPGLKKLAAAIKDAGGRACIQIWHGGRVAPGTVEGYTQLAASAVPLMGSPKAPKEITKEEIKEIIEAYADAVARAKESGFDAVELHFGHGYLPSSFMSRHTNRRTDEYGGTFENRIRFPLEVIKRVREKIGREFPVMMRISGEEHIENGITIDEMIEFSKLAEEAGIDAIDVSVGIPEGAAIKYEVPPIDLPVGFNVENAYKIKQNVKVPVVAVGRINDPLYAEKLIDDGKADFVAIGRGQLSDPEFCNKAMRGEFDNIVKCIGCDQGCFDRYMIPGAAISCLRNPSCGREADMKIVENQQKKKVLVIGGGPAGMQAALVLKQRGHDVVLCEKTSSLGGQFYLAGVAPRKEEMSEAARQMGQFVKRAGVEIRLQTEVTPEVIAKIAPDEVIIATGAIPFQLPVDGIEKEHVVAAFDVLRGIKTVKDRVVIIGGGLIGLEIAELLTEQLKDVTVVELMDEVGKDLGILRKICVMGNIYSNRVKVLTGAKCMEILDYSVKLEKDGEIITVDNVESVVVAAGAKPADNSAVEEYLKNSSIKYHVIGDAVKPRRAIDAIWEGTEVGMKI